MDRVTECPGDFDGDKQPGCDVAEWRLTQGDTSRTVKYNGWRAANLQVRFMVATTRGPVEWMVSVATRGTGAVMLLKMSTIHEVKRQRPHSTPIWVRGWLVLCGWLVAVTATAVVTWAQETIPPIERNLLKPGTRIMARTPDVPLLLGTEVLGRAGDLNPVLKIRRVVGQSVEVSSGPHVGWMSFQEIVLASRGVPFFSRRLEMQETAADHVGLGWSHYVQDELDSALESFEHAIALDPGLGMAWYGKGMVHKAQGNAEEACDDLEQAILLQRRVPGIYFALAQLYLELEEPERACICLNMVTRLHPEHVAAVELRAQLWMNSQYYAQAAADMSQLLKWQPARHELYLQRALCYLGAEMYPQALKDLNRVIEREPNTAYYYLQRASIHISLDDPDRALKDCDTALEIEPPVGKEQVLPQRANALMLKGEYEKALADLDELVLLVPTGSTGYNGRAWLLATAADKKFRDGARAIEDARKACEIDQWQSAASLDTLAAAHAEAGQFDEAVEWQAKALEIGFALPHLDREAQARLELFRNKKPYRDRVIDKTKPAAPAKKPAE